MNSDRVESAAAELYAADPDGFVERRRALAAEARDSGDALAAKAIAALRKPTRSAWTLNALARSDAAAFDEVDALGAQLREAERRLDGGQLRELSRQRRSLVDTLARRAFAATGQRAPSTALREEVNATLLAAFADESVAEQLRAGALVRGAQWDGFGSGARPGLSVVPGGRANLRAVPSPVPSPAVSPRNRERVATVEREVSAARRELARAEAQAGKHRDRVRAAEEQLAAAQRTAAEASRAVREAKATLRQAEQRLDRATRS